MDQKIKGFLLKSFIFLFFKPFEFFLAQINPILSINENLYHCCGINSLLIVKNI